MFFTLYAMDRDQKGLAIAVRSVDSGENSRIITLLGPSIGIIEAVFYGARKSTRGIKVPVYAEGSYSLYRNGENGRWSIKDVDVISYHEPVSQDLGKSMAAMLFSELAMASGSADAMLYSLFVSALDALEDHDEEKVAIDYIVHYMSSFGQSGNWRSCPLCQREYRDDEVIGFSAMEGVASCSDCDTMSMSFPLPPNARKYLMRTLELGFGDALRLSASKEQTHRIFRYMLRTLGMVFPGRLRSLEHGIWDL